jgi:hypothetical protein
MIRFKAYSEDRSRVVFGLGLDRENVTRLVAGRPIAINLADQMGPDVDVVICFGETQDDLFEELKAGGLIPPQATFTPAESGHTNITRIKVNHPEEEGPGHA